jgi:signal transduction histidine kinase
MATFIGLSSIATGGFDSPNYPWFFLVPLCAAFILGTRGATWWTGGMLALTALFWVAQVAGLFPQSVVPEAMRGTSLVFDRMLLIVAIGVIGASGVHAQRETERQLSLAKDEAEREASYRELLMHAAVVSGEADSLRQAMNDGVARICDAMGWLGGAVYEVDDDGRAAFAGTVASCERLRPLHAVVQGRSPARMGGTVGRAASTGLPQLAPISFDRIPDEIGDLVRKAGIIRAFAVPVKVGEEVRAVLEFALGEVPEDADRLSDVFSLIGRQFGRVGERIRIQEHLRQRQKMEAVGQLAAGVAHEINNPMSYVRSNLHSLRERFQELRSKLRTSELDEADALIEESLEGVEHAIRIVRDVREFSHMGSGTGDRIPASLAEIADAAHRVAAGRAPSGVKFEVVHSAAARCSCSPHQIQQVVANLLVNACQAVRREGRIRLETGTRGASGFVRVSDDGCGISEPDRSRLFEPFFTTKAVGQGTGLGLSVSYEIVRGHGGDIRVTSEPGHGASFEVRLPLATDSNG